MDEFQAELSRKRRKQKEREIKEKNAKISSSNNDSLTSSSNVPGSGPSTAPVNEDDLKEDYKDWLCSATPQNVRNELTKVLDYLVCWLANHNVRGSDS